MPSILITFTSSRPSHAGARALIIKPTTNDRKLMTKVDGAETSRHYRPLAFERRASVVWSTRCFSSNVGHLHSRLLVLVLVLLMLVTGEAELPGRPSSLDLLVTAGVNTSKEFLERSSLMVPWQETKAMSRGRRLVACDFKFSDDTSLTNTGGWNVLSVSCVLGSQIRVNSGTTMRVKKDPSVSSPVVIDRQAMAYLPVGRHFYVTAGTLEMEGVTLIGGSVDYGGVVFVFTGSASFQACSFSGNKAQNTVSSFLLTHLLSITFLFFLLISFFDFVFLSSSEADIFSTSLCFMLCFIYFLSFIFLSFFCRLCVGVSFLFLSSQGGAVAVRFGSAFFQACSFSQNNAVGDSVSTFVLNSFFDLLPLLFPCVCVPPPPPSIENSS